MCYLAKSHNIYLFSYFSSSFLPTESYIILPSLILSSQDQPYEGDQMGPREQNYLNLGLLESSLNLCAKLTLQGYVTHAYSY